MREIVNRLHENRQIEKAKKLLESKGYEVVKESKLSDQELDIDHADSEQGSYPPKSRRGRKPNGDLKDDEVFTPGSEDEKLHKGIPVPDDNSTNSKYRVYYIESTERGDQFKHIDVDAETAEFAKSKVLSMFKDWSDKDIYRIEGTSKVDESLNEDIDEWDPYRGKKYKVVGEYGDIVSTDDPKEAIEAWFKLGQKSPLDTAIMSKTKADAIEITKSATEDLLTSLYSKYKCPYKLDYLIDESKKKVADGQKYFHEDKYGYGDSVHPFGVG